MPNTISILSLLVAALAVFVGPLITWRVARKQIDSAQRIAMRQVVAPMRQAWINSLRKLLSELLGGSHHYWAAGFEDRTDSEYRRMTEIEHEIVLMLNPNEALHDDLRVEIRELMASLSSGNNREADERFFRAHQRTIKMSQAILKQEWQRTKAGD